MRIQKYTALELDTAQKVEGYYYLENGYWMCGDIRDLSKPVERHYIVVSNGKHIEIAETTLKELIDIEDNGAQQAIDHMFGDPVEALNKLKVRP